MTTAAKKRVGEIVLAVVSAVIITWAVASISHGERITRLETRDETVIPELNRRLERIESMLADIGGRLP